MMIMVIITITLIALITIFGGKEGLKNKAKGKN